MTTKTKTPLEKREAAEAKAFIAYKEVLETAFKADGFQGVIHTSYSLVEQARALTNGYTDSTPKDVERKEIAEFIETMWTGLQLAHFEKRPEVEIAAVIAEKMANAEELSQASVDKITHPGLRAVVQQMHDITKDAPPISGLAALEAKYGKGKVPMQAVHECADMDFDTKKFLFSLAGFEYDGTVHEAPAKGKAALTDVDKAALLSFSDRVEHKGFRAHLRAKAKS